MKRLIVAVIAILLTGFAGFIISCDKVEPPYMNVTDVSDCPVPTFPDITSPQKTVMVEDFTGHQCTYCPTAADYIHQIKQLYGINVIVLSIHATGLAEPQSPPWDLDLRPVNNIGADFMTDFVIPSALPRAMISREKFGGSSYSYGSPSTWQAKVETVLAQDPELYIQIINNYDSASRKLCSHIKTKFLHANSQNLKIAIFISEDSIVGYQSNNNAALGSDPITDYVFMDVMREGLLGAYGEILTSGNVAQDSSVIRTYKKILPATWIDKHCKVVAYVYDADTKVILQAVEGKVIELP